MSRWALLGCSVLVVAVLGISQVSSQPSTDREPVGNVADCDWIPRPDFQRILYDKAQGMVTIYPYGDPELGMWPPLSNTELKRILDFPKVESVEFRRVPITRCQLSILASKHKLKSLSFSYCGIGDSVATVASSIPQLEYLNLSGTHISDHTLQRLSGHPALQHLVVEDVKTITGESVKEFQARTPNCRYEGQ